MVIIPAGKKAKSGAPHSSVFGPLFSSTYPVLNPSQYIHPFNTFRLDV